MEEEEKQNINSGDDNTEINDNPHDIKNSGDKKSKPVKPQRPTGEILTEGIDPSKIIHKKNNKWNFILFNSNYLLSFHSLHFFICHTIQDVKDYVDLSFYDFDSYYSSADELNLSFAG